MERNGSGQVPPRALEYRAAVRRYYYDDNGTLKTQRPPQDPDIAALLGISERTWQRRKQALREGRWGDRNWLEVWPPPPDWHPSWEDLLPLQPALPESDGLLHVVYEEVFDKSGKLVERRLLSPFNHFTVLAMGVAVRVLADYLSDGRLDGVVRLCSLIARMPKLT